jgi:hypothetical protein
VNARTDHDYNRWGDFISGRPEVEYVSFEFGTGAGWPDRFEWHVRNLCRLGKGVDHDLNLILRGGIQAIPRLRDAFSSISVIQTTSFKKTMLRQRASLLEGRLVWDACPSYPGERLHDRFECNAIFFRKNVRALNRLGMENVLTALPAQHRNAEPPEVRLLNDPSTF